MPTKRCAVCGRAEQIDTKDLTCSVCEEKELDLLMAVYAFIHCYESDYCPPNQIMESVDPIRAVKVDVKYLQSWIDKQWLEKNEMNNVRIPPPIQEEIDEHGFSAGAPIRSILEQRKNEDSQYDPNLLEGFRRKIEDEKPRVYGMAYMDKKRKNHT